MMYALVLIGILHLRLFQASDKFSDKDFFVLVAVSQIALLYAIYAIVRFPHPLSDLMAIFAGIVIAFFP